MLWIRDIPSYRFLKPTSWKIANRQDRRITPFQVVGLDFAGPIGYKPVTKKKRKSYIFLLACSLTRAVHLALLPNQTAKEFLKHRERLITRKRPPQEYYLYNEQHLCRYLCSYLFSSVNHTYTRSTLCIEHCFTDFKFKPLI